MKSEMTKIFMLSVALGLVAFNASAADQNTATAPQDPKASEQSGMTSEQFQRSSTLNQLHHLNQKEIQLTQMAMEKSQSPQVKNMAKHMMEDHQKAEEKVKQVAKASNIELTDFQPATHEKAMMENFEKLQGAQFDMAFINAMRQGHQQAVEELKIFSKSKDPQIRSLTKGMLPAIREHQKMASKLKKFARQSEMAGQAE